MEQFSDEHRCWSFLQTNCAYFLYNFWKITSIAVSTLCLGSWERFWSLHINQKHKLKLELWQDLAELSEQSRPPHAAAVTEGATIATALRTPADGSTGTETGNTERCLHGSERDSCFWNNCPSQGILRFIIRFPPLWLYPLSEVPTGNA